MPLLKAHSLVIDKYLKELSSPWDLKEPVPLEIRRQDRNEEHYFCFPIYFFPPPAEKSPSLVWSLYQAFFLPAWFGGVLRYSKGKKVD